MEVVWLYFCVYFKGAMTSTVSASYFDIFSGSNQYNVTDAVDRA